MPESTLKPQTSVKTPFRTEKSIGGTVSKYSSFVAGNKKHFFIVVGSNLRIYYLATKQCIRTFPLDVNKVSDIFLDEKDLIWIAYNDGTVLCLDWLNRNILYTLDLTVPIKKLVAVFENGTKFIIISHSDVHKPSVSKVCYVTIDTEHKPDLTEIYTIGNEKINSNSNSNTNTNINFTYRCLKFSSSNSCLAYIIDPSSKSKKKSEKSEKFEKIVIVKFANDFKSFNEQTITRQNHKSVTLAVSNDGLLAVGGESGVIDLYYGIFSTNDDNKNNKNNNQIKSRALKWHMSPVKALEFSLNANYLLSGAQEHVLVFWQLETDNVQFLPRLSGTITNILSNKSSEYYSITLNNLETILVSAQDLTVKLSISGIKSSFTNLPHKHKFKSQSKIPDYTALMRIHPITRLLYFTTSTDSQLQVYDPIRDDQIDIQQIASSIQIGKIQTEQLISDPFISDVQFSSDGLWMLTVDELNNPSIDALLSENDTHTNLRFWYKPSLASSSKWELTTRISNPHGVNSRVLSAINVPTNYNNGMGFLTVSEYGDMKIWTPKLQNLSENNKTSQQIEWTVKKHFQFANLKSSAVAVAWSEDASVIILAFETSLYAFDGFTLELVNVLPNVLCSRVRDIRIVKNFLIAVTKTRLVVFNLLTNLICWSLLIPFPPGGKRLLATTTFSMSSNEDSDDFIAIGNNYLSKESKLKGRIFVFNIKSPIPKHVSSHSAAISSVSFIPGTTDVLFLDINSTVSTLSHTQMTTNLSGKSTIESNNKTARRGSTVTLDGGLLNTYEPKNQAKNIINGEIIIDNSSVSEDSKTIINEERDLILTEESIEKLFIGPEFAMGNLEALLDRVLTTVDGQVH